MIALIWAFLFTSSAQDLMSSVIEPKELLEKEKQSKEDQKFINEMLKSYAKNSKYVVVGEVLEVRDRGTNQGQDREARILVDSRMRGETDQEIVVFIPHNAPFIEGEWDSVPGKMVQGYSIVVFLDNQKRVVEGNAIFYTDGEYLWRNKRPSLFLHPSYDREWKEQNPYDDYIVFPVQDAQRWLSKQKMGSWLR